MDTKVKYSFKSSLHEMRFVTAWATKVKFFVLHIYTCESQVHRLTLNKALLFTYYPQPSIKSQDYILLGITLYVLLSHAFTKHRMDKVKLWKILVQVLSTKAATEWDVKKLHSRLCRLKKRLYPVIPFPLSLNIYTESIGHWAWQETPQLWVQLITGCFPIIFE